MSEAYPHIILEGFSSKLGQRTSNVLKYLFPVPKDDRRASAPPFLGGTAAGAALEEAFRPGGWHSRLLPKRPVAELVPGRPAPLALAASAS